MKTPKYVHPANPAKAQAEAERRRSNAAGIHLDKRTARLRTRAARNTAARHEYRRTNTGRVPG